ncbi:uncharacterized protein LOC134217926 [Armigeres subalbatus]|uniref:uncharacterized protein LOC134217926 n=1 Tax=Armigeres subalbatus TaxID=124917 RepID=UPI002ED40655
MRFYLAPLVFAALSIGIYDCKPTSEESNELNASEERNAIEQLKEHFEDACIRNSRSTVTYAEVMEAVSETTACFGANVDYGEFLADWRRLNSDTRGVFFAKYCPLIKNTTSVCLEPVEELSKLCMDPGAQRVEAPDFPLYLLPKVVDLVCQGNGAILFANSDSDERPTSCFENYFSYIQRCMKNFVSETGAKSRQDYGELECRVLQKSRECVQKKLSDCGNAGLIQVFDVPYQTIVQETKCRHFI